ncbi:MAG: hypothetical protein V7L26_17420 [Nostoc sp.]
MGISLLPVARSLFPFKPFFAPLRRQSPQVGKHAHGAASSLRE